MADRGLPGGDPRGPPRGGIGWRSAVAQALGDWALPEYAPPLEPERRACDQTVPAAPPAPVTPAIPAPWRKPVRGGVQTDLLALLG